MPTDPFTVYLRKGKLCLFLASYLIYHFTVSVVNNHSQTSAVVSKPFYFFSTICFVLGLPRGVFMRLQRAVLASASSCFHPGCCRSVCSSWQVTRPPGLRLWECCPSPLGYKKQNLLSEGETWLREHNSPIPENLIFSSGGKKNPCTLHICQRSESHLWPWTGSFAAGAGHGDSNHGRRHGVIHLGRSQLEWCGDSQITEGF